MKRLDSVRLLFQCVLSCNTHGPLVCFCSPPMAATRSWPSDSLRNATPSGRWKRSENGAPACGLTFLPHAIANRRHIAVAKSAAEERPKRQLLSPPCGWYTSSGACSAPGRHVRGRVHGIVGASGRCRSRMNAAASVTFMLPIADAHTGAQMCSARAPPRRATVY